MSRRLEIVLSEATEGKPHVEFGIVGGNANVRPSPFDFANTYGRRSIEAVVIFDVLDQPPGLNDVSFSIGRNYSPLLTAKPAIPGTVQAFAGELSRLIPDLHGISEDDLTRIHDRERGIQDSES